MRRLQIQGEAGGSRGRHGARAKASSPDLERVGVGAIAFGLCFWTAQRGGGYDLVARQEIGIAIWWALALALCFAVVPRSRPPREVRRAAVALFVLVAATGVGSIAAESAESALDELARVVAYGGVLALAWLGLSARTWRAAATGVGLAALAICIVAVGSRLGLAGLTTEGMLAGRRLADPIGYWNALAAAGAMAFGFALAWGSHSRRPARRGAALAMLPLCGLTVYLTYSRAGLVSLAIASAVVIFASANRVTAAVHALAGVAATVGVIAVARSTVEIADGTGTEGAWLVALALAVASTGLAALAVAGLNLGLDRRRPTRRQLAVASALAAVAAAGVVTAMIASLGAGSDVAAAPGYAVEADDPAVRLVSLDDGRGALWSAALRAFESEPLTGIGAGSFGLWWARDGDGALVDDAHSLYVETLAELGPLGLAALIAFLAALGVAAVRARLALVRRGEIAMAAASLAAGAVFAVHAGVDWLWEFPALVMVGLGAPAVLAAARADRIRPARRLRPGRIALVAMAIAAGATQIPGIVSENRLRAARAAASAGLVERGLQLADDAVRARPWAATPRAVRAELLLASGDLARARAAIAEAIERESTNWRHRLVLVRIALEQGHETAAQAALDELARLRPAAGERAAPLVREPRPEAE